MARVALYWERGPQKGKPKLCKLCPQPMYEKSHGLRLCSAHYRAHGVARQLKYLRKINEPIRLHNMILTLSRHPHTGRCFRKDGTRKNLSQQIRAMFGARKHWKNLILNHPEKLPAGAMEHFLKQHSLLPPLS